MFSLTITFACSSLCSHCFALHSLPYFFTFAFSLHTLTLSLLHLYTRNLCLLSHPPPFALFCFHILHFLISIPSLFHFSPSPPLHPYTSLFYFLAPLASVPLPLAILLLCLLFTLLLLLPCYFALSLSHCSHFFRSSLSFTCSCLPLTHPFLCFSTTRLPSALLPYLLTSSLLALTALAPTPCYFLTFRSPCQRTWPIFLKCF